MITIAAYDEKGDIICSGHCNNQTISHYESLGYKVIEVDEIVTNKTHYVKNDCLKNLPLKPSDFHIWDVEREIWILNEYGIANARNDKRMSLDVMCKDHIVSGFISSALGEPHTYPSKETDQANLNASVTASMYPGLPQDWITPFWCERDGQWRYRMHTASQIQQVGFDGKNAVLSFLAKNASLQEQLTNAQTIEDIMAVQW